MEKKATRKNRPNHNQPHEKADRKQYKEKDKNPEAFKNKRRKEPKEPFRDPALSSCTNAEPKLKQNLKNRA
jgi:hypothetical protein